MTGSEESDSSKRIIDIQNAQEDETTDEYFARKKAEYDAEFRRLHGGWSRQAVQCAEETAGCACGLVICWALITVPILLYAYAHWLFRVLGVS